MVRGPAHSSAVALLFSHAPGPNTVGVCRWLHRRGLSATFFLDPRFRGPLSTISRLRPFEVGVAAPSPRRPVAAPALEAALVLGEGRIPFQLVPRGLRGRVPAEATTPVAPSALLRLHLPPEEWEGELEGVVRHLRGGELLLVELGETPLDDHLISRRLDQTAEVLSQRGLKIWGLRALLRGEYEQ